MHPSTHSIIAYASPALLGAALMGFCARANCWFALAALPGTVVHELLHWVGGAITFARPIGMTFVPRRLPNGTLQLGSVWFQNVRWWNAVFAALAPLAGYPLTWAIASVRLHSGRPFDLWDVAIWFALAQVVFASWPSPVDWRLALRSWPLGAVSIIVAWILWGHSAIETGMRAILW